MTLVTVQFNYPPTMNRPDYELLLKVFTSSIKRHMPDMKIQDIRLDPPMPKNGDTTGMSYLYNTYKLDEWARIVEEATDNLILADCDMLMMRPFTEDEIFGFDFDVAYTERTEERTRLDTVTKQHWGDKPIEHMPMNGGIMFVKPTQASKKYFRKYARINQYLFDHPDIHEKWRVKYAGMNQAAFGCLLEEGNYDAKLIGVPCRRWNAVDTDWHMVQQKTVFLHIKSKLRRLVLSLQRPYGNYKYAMQAWYEEAKSIGAPVWN